MKRHRRRVDVNLQGLDDVLDEARQTPLSGPDYQKLKGTLHTLVELLTPSAPKRRAQCWRKLQAHR